MHALILAVIVEVVAVSVHRIKLEISCQTSAYFDLPWKHHQPYGQLVADAQDQQSAPMAWNPPVSK